MAKDEKLDTFRIAERRRPEVRSRGRLPEKAAPEPAPSTGFPAIEQRLEGGSIEALADELRDTYARLEALADSKSPRDKAAARKALAAYERTADLFEYLFATKNQLGR